jgi:predicted MFS family arabinose efflux permease
MKMGWPVVIGIVVGGVIGYVGSRAMGYADPALFGAIGVVIGTIVAFVVERSRASRT